jgi:hypothetical protein
VQRLEHWMLTIAIVRNLFIKEAEAFRIGFAAMSYLTERHSKLRDLYANLMDEVKRRTNFMKEIAEGRPPLPQVIVQEISYLQLRLICELIALGCLVAHGDIPEVSAKKLRDEYAADAIVKALEKLHPEFYPTPGDQVLDQTGKVIRVDDVESGFLTKQELPRLWGRCGDYLHRGTLRSILDGKERPIEMRKIQSWRDKIVRLLNHHQIHLSDGRHQLWVIMQGKNDNRVHVTLFQRRDSEAAVT